MAIAGFDDDFKVLKKACGTIVSTSCSKSSASQDTFAKQVNKLKDCKVKDRPLIVEKILDFLQEYCNDSSPKPVDLELNENVPNMKNLKRNPPVSTSLPLIDDVSEFFRLTRELLSAEEESYGDKNPVEKGIPESSSIVFKRTNHYVRNLLSCCAILLDSFFSVTLLQDIYDLLNMMLLYLSDFYHLYQKKSPFSFEYLKFIEQALSMPVVLLEMPAKSTWKKAVVTLIQLVSNQSLLDCLRKLDLNMMHPLEVLESIIEPGSLIIESTGSITLAHEDPLIYRCLAILAHYISYRVPHFGSVFCLVFYEFLLTHGNESPVHCQLLSSLNYLLKGELFLSSYGHIDLTNPFFLVFKSHLSELLLEKFWSSKTLPFWFEIVHNLAVSLSSAPDYLYSLQWVDKLIDLMLKELLKPKNYSRLAKLISLNVFQFRELLSSSQSSLFCSNKDAFLDAMASSSVSLSPIIFPLLFRSLILFLAKSSMLDKVRSFLLSISEIIFDEKLLPYPKILCFQLLLSLPSEVSSYLKEIHNRVYASLISFSSEVVPYAIISISGFEDGLHDFNLVEYWKYMLILMRHVDNVLVSCEVLLSLLQSFVIPIDLLRDLLPELRLLLYPHNFCKVLVEICVIVVCRSGQGRADFEIKFSNWFTKNILTSTLSYEDFEFLLSQYSKIGSPCFSEELLVSALPQNLLFLSCHQEFPVKLLSFDGVIFSRDLVKIDVSLLCEEHIEPFIQFLVESLEAVVAACSSTSSTRQSSGFLCYQEYWPTIFAILQFLVKSCKIESKSSRCRLFLDDLSKYLASEANNWRELCPATTRLFPLSVKELTADIKDIAFCHRKVLCVVATLYSDNFHPTDLAISGKQWEELHSYLLEPLSYLCPHDVFSPILLHTDGYVPCISELSVVNLDFAFLLCSRLLKNSASTFAKNVERVIEIIITCELRRFKTLYSVLLSTFKNVKISAINNKLLRHHFFAQWVNMGHLSINSPTLSLLPFEFLGICDANISVDIVFKLYLPELLPFMCLKDIQLAKKLLDGNASGVVASCYPVIIGSVFPLYFCGSTSKAKLASNIITGIVRENVSEEEFDQLFLANLSEILVLIISRVSTDNASASVSTNQFEKKAIIDTLNHVAKILRFKDLLGSEGLFTSSMTRFCSFFTLFLQALEEEFMLFQDIARLSAIYGFLADIVGFSGNGAFSEPICQFFNFCFVCLSSRCGISEKWILSWMRERKFISYYYSILKARCDSSSPTSCFTIDSFCRNLIAMPLASSSIISTLFSFLRNRSSFLIKTFSDELLKFEELSAFLAEFCTVRSSKVHGLALPHLDEKSTVLLQVLRQLVDYIADVCDNHEAALFFADLFGLMNTCPSSEELVCDCVYFVIFYLVFYTDCTDFLTQEIEDLFFSSEDSSRIFAHLLLFFHEKVAVTSGDQWGFYPKYCEGVSFKRLAQLLCLSVEDSNNLELSFYFWSLADDISRESRELNTQSTCTSVNSESAYVAYILPKLCYLDPDILSGIQSSQFAGAEACIFSYGTAGHTSIESYLHQSPTRNSNILQRIDDKRLMELENWDLPRESPLFPVLPTSSLATAQRFRGSTTSITPLTVLEHLRNLVPKYKDVNDFKLASLRLKLATVINSTDLKDELEKFKLLKLPSNLLAYLESRWFKSEEKNGVRDLAINWLRYKLVPVEATDSFEFLIYLNCLGSLGEWADDERDIGAMEIYSNYYSSLELKLRKLNAHHPFANCSFASLSIAELMSFFELKGPGDLYAQVAAFHDRQYENRITSLELSSWSSLIHAKAQEISSLENGLADMKSSNISKPTIATAEKALLAMKAQLEGDKSEYEKILLDTNGYLYKAFENYLASLMFSASDSLPESPMTTVPADMTISCICRIVTLWFKHGDFLARPFEEFLLQPTFPWSSFLPLLYQLVSKISNQDADSEFQKLLKMILEHLVEKFPFETVYPLLYFKNSANIAKKAFAGGSDQKVGIAREILAKCKSMRSTLKEKITAMDSLADAYIELALKDLRGLDTKDLSTAQPMESSSLVRNVSKFAILPVITSSASICSVKIARFKGTFTLIGGMNLPKVVECQGSDGNWYRQLVKSRDDLRQDAIMSQLFSLFDSVVQNAFLRTNSNRRQGFRIRTYKVIPLQPLAGVIEWIANTVPIGDYLQKAHDKYGVASDLAPTAVRALAKKEFDAMAGNSKSKQARLSFFKEKILARFHPVFRYFFYEVPPSTHPEIKEVEAHAKTDPAGWYSRKLIYTRSMALSCMIGYVVGLGDRHTQNILLDRATFEICQIDLNLIFEQGKQLKVPERVPFRLTQDLVDGLSFNGPLGGAFPIHCQAALELLKSKKELIMSLLQVVKWDPLYKWNITSQFNQKFVKEKQAGNLGGAALPRFTGVDLSREMTIAATKSTQICGPTGAMPAFSLIPPDLDGTTTSLTSNASKRKLDRGRSDARADENAGGGGGDIMMTIAVNPEAERALLRVKEKLLGLEEGSILSTKGHVKYLIQAATNPENLCQMYYGWQPWM